MVRILIFVKHHLTFIWTFIEWCNSVLFQILWGRRLKRVIAECLSNFEGTYSFRLLKVDDMADLADFFVNQPKSAYEFFKPHDFDEKSLIKKCKDSAFVMLGAFDGNKLVGYFFLRCFFNKQAFRGKIVDVNYQGRGIAKQMGILTTQICVGMKFRIYATISKDNVKSIASSKAVNEVRVVKELPDNYLYVEYLLK